MTASPQLQGAAHYFVLEPRNCRYYRLDRQASACPRIQGWADARALSRALRTGRAVHSCKGAQSRRSTGFRERCLLLFPAGFSSGTHEIRNLFVETAHSFILLEFLSSWLIRAGNESSVPSGMYSSRGGKSEYWLITWRSCRLGGTSPVCGSPVTPRSGVTGTARPTFRWLYRELVQARWAGRFGTGASLKL